MFANSSGVNLHISPFAVQRPLGQSEDGAEGEQVAARTHSGGDLLLVVQVHILLEQSEHKVVAILRYSVDAALEATGDL